MAKSALNGKLINFSNITPAQKTAGPKALKLAPLSNALSHYYEASLICANVPMMLRLVLSAKDRQLAQASFFSLHVLSYR